ncbi:hypothetical protein J5288_06715 [Agrobacterium sp. S2/73]|uniref:hypothetical protein n=1 Tax=Agrobacterium TaxID=357 RepID=UPI000FB16B12|nr:MULTISPECIES: hypothetical protein [unclassified Agrobacterium]MBO9108394.1 hypothetical protein [Agrobacterium sp. S2/73]NTA10021.1 hypothetical protein [Agrobacterium tumefaciens]QXZ71027.1 hypothetical protein J5276_07795 [Agrobacterium sp. S7/73]
MEKTEWWNGMYVVRANSRRLHKVMGATSKLFVIVDADERSGEPIDGEEARVLPIASLTAEDEADCLFTSFKSYRASEGMCNAG